MADVEVFDLIQARCVLEDPNGVTGIGGTINFYQDKEGEVTYYGKVTGLTAGKHGFHTHTKGNVNFSCADADGHYNPFDKTHASPTIAFADRHRGAQGNIVADATGVAYVNMKVQGVSLNDDNFIIERSIVVHAGEDDLGLGTGAEEAGSLASGNAGARIGCCQIERVRSIPFGYPAGSRCNMKARGPSEEEAKGNGIDGFCGTGLCCGHLALATEANIGLNAFCGDAKAASKISASSSAPGFNAAQTQTEYDFKCGEMGMRVISSLAAVALSAFLIN